MLGTLQHVLILQKKRRRRQSYQPPRGDQQQNSVSRTQLGAKSGDHHRGVENDPSHVTSHRMSHRMGYFNFLEIVVTSEGRPERIKIIKSPSPDLAHSAVQAVQSWRFKPAIGFDGSPVAVFTPIEVTFRRR